MRKNGPVAESASSTLSAFAASWRIALPFSTSEQAGSRAYQMEIDAFRLLKQEILFAAFVS